MLRFLRVTLLGVALIQPSLSKDARNDGMDYGNFTGTNLVVKS